MSLDVNPLSGGIGAEILGADVRDPKDFDAIMSAFVEFGVIAIRDQQLSPIDQIEFARRFGPININRFFARVPGHDEVALVLKEPEQKSAIGERWHTDHSYDREPAMCSILYALETPPIGGDTYFASMYSSFNALSDGLKQTLRDMRAWHSSRHIFGPAREDKETRASGRIGNQELATQDACHPAVIRHPLSGREALYVNPEFTTHFDGWSPAESKSLINYLAEHCTQPEFTCRLRWAPGTITIWDNRATWHKAVNDYHGYRRLMHRITVEGPALANATRAAA